MPKRQTDPAQTSRERGRANGAAEAEPAHSGRLLLRMPPSLHGELARAADTDGVSLNQFITSALSSAVGWRASGDSGAEPQRRVPARQRSGRNLLLTLNLIVLVVLAALAVVLLVTAWHQG